MLGLGFFTNKSSSSEASSIAGRAPGFTGLLDESYGGSAAAAYSLRRLSNSYEGKAVQIRRASDNVEVDVGFDANNEISLDSPVTNVTEETTGSSPSPDFSRADNLGQFVGNASYENKDLLGSPDSALLQCWYDQSGNSNNLIQSTAGDQPQILSSGSLIDLNGKPTLQFAAGDFMADTGWNGASTSYIFNVLKSNGSESTPRIGIDVGSYTEYYGLGVDGNGGASSGGITSLAQTSNGTAISTSRDAMWDAMQFQNVLSVSGDFSTWTGGFGLARSGISMYTFAQEFVIYNADKSGQRADIESNISTFYSIS